jgi:hypothetical protein
VPLRLCDVVPESVGEPLTEKVTVAVPLAERLTVGERE